MITVFPANTTDFSTNGLCALSPSSCAATETLNGEWELYTVHPLDGQGKWSWLQVGNIIKAPVPSALSPRLKLLSSTEGRDVYRISISGSARLKLYSRASSTSICLGAYRDAALVQVLDSSHVSFCEVITPDGKRGYMAKGSLLHLRTEASCAAASATVVQASQTRDQPFRIYRIVPSLTSVEVYARHLSYDLMDNMLYQYKPANGTSGADVASGILSRCQSAQPFTMFSNLTASVDDLVLENTNPMDALLGEGGLADKTNGEIIRDWYDLYMLSRVGSDTDIQVRQGKNLLGITYDVDDGNVVTRIVPTGETEDGELLYLDGKFIDSPNIAAFPHPRWVHLPVSEARVSDDMTLAQVKAKLTSAAYEEFTKGCDLPDITIHVDFINLADTQEYAQYRPLTDIFPGDSIRVIVSSLALEVTLRMTAHSYDCLLKRYEKMTLGSAARSVSGSMISPRQLPAGGISGTKLAMGAVGTGHLQRASIGSLQVKTAAIGAAHIQQAAIGQAHIIDANITTAKIADAAVTNAKIALANISTAHIADAAITSAKIGTAEVKAANIEDLSVNAAKIALATITSAQIADAAIETAKIHDAAITRAKIADAAVGNAQIENAAITSAKIGLAAIDTAHIGVGVVGTEQVADGSITDAKIVGLTANKITAGTIDAADINVINLNAANLTVGTINGQQIAPNAIGSEHIGAGVITNAMIASGTINGDKISIGTVAAERLKLSQHLLY